MLKQRIITAIVLALVLLGTIFYGGSLGVQILFAVILAAATYELSNLTLKLNLPITLVISVILAAVFLWRGGNLDPLVIYQLAMVGSIIWVGIFVYLPIYRFTGNGSLIARVLFFAMGLLLLWICVHGLLFVLQQNGLVLVYLMSLVWVADIGAYFSGKQFGRNKLAPNISPGKTWEGVIGGVIANVIWMLLVFSYTQGWGLSLIWFLAIGLATSAISVVGDLFESILKREAAVKDSSKLLPGHGGVLDRIDSVIAAVPIFVLGLFLSGLF